MNGEANPRPDVATERLLQYLDDLRMSGVTNMFGAGAYLVAEFGLTRVDAQRVLAYWMRSYGERHPRRA